MSNQTGDRFKRILGRLEQEDSQNQDVTISKDALSTTSDGKILIEGVGEAGFTQTGLAQFCNRFGMPVRYAEKCLSKDPKMFADHMKIWINEHEEDKQMLVRMTNTGNGNKIRAVLSDRYGIKDNLEVVKDLGGYLADSGLGEVREFSSSQDFLDLRVRFPEYKRVIGKLKNNTDDWIMPGVHIRNSEVGLSRISISVYIDRLICSNGMTVSRGLTSISRKHSGTVDVDVKQDILPVIAQLEDKVNEYSERMVSLKSQKFENALDEFELLVNQFEMSEAQVNKIIKGYKEEMGNFDGMTRHHILQAITAAARETENWSERLKLEHVAEDYLFLAR